MKDKIGIAIVALVSVLISCFFTAGCVPAPGYITIDSRSKVMKPAFRMYLDRCFRHHQVQLEIGTIIIWKSLYSSEEETRWEFNAGHISLPLGYYRRPVESKMVWYLHYEPSDNFIKRLLGGSTSPVSFLTYGEVPPGYEEIVKAGPLEPERYYVVQMHEYRGRPSEGMTFIIRLNETGIPERLEYHMNDFFITNPRYFKGPRDALKLY